MDGSAPVKLSLPAKPMAAKRVHTKITFQRELFKDIWHEIGRLFVMHDKEIWPDRTWGPLAPDADGYLQVEKSGRLLIVTARAGASRRLIGYSFDIILGGSLHYSRTSHALNDIIWLHPDYRVGKGLSIRKSPGFRLLQERERQLDILKIVRRRMDPKVHREFGALLKPLGYSPEAIIYQKIVLPEDE